MKAWKQKQTWLFAAALLFGALFLPAVTFAAQSNSSNFQVNEVFFGSGGELNACSTGSYCAKQSAGELAVGNTSSANYQAQGGFNTDRTPYIEFTTSNTNSDLGTMTPTAAKTANANFTVKAYLAHGYAVTNASDPPKNGTYTMQNLALPDNSSPGDEQFGINLVANTDPATFGANPVQDPNNTFSFGMVSADYSAADTYKYVKGDTVAYSDSSTSFTTYTVSYMFNVSNITPGGQYIMYHVLVATGTY
jgi:hypothetical protein